MEILLHSFVSLSTEHILGMLCVYLYIYIDILLLLFQTFYIQVKLQSKCRDLSVSIYYLGE